MDNIPTSTKWVRDSIGSAGRSVVDSVYLIENKSMQTKGTGFAIEGEYIITNNHVISQSDIEDISATSAYDTNVDIAGLYSYPKQDIAILEPSEMLKNCIGLKSTEDLKPGDQVATWGYPLGYSGPAPILSVGYIAGFQENKVDNQLFREIIVNGAFNNGNSGGPLFLRGDDQAIGIVVSKHAPLTERQISIMDTLQNTAGMIPQKGDLSISQMIAAWLTDLNQLTQVMIGHAIDAEELQQLIVDIEQD